MKVNEIITESAVANFPEDEEFYGIVPGLNYIPTDSLAPNEDLRSQWQTIKAVMADDGKTKEQWAAWWLGKNDRPAEIQWSNARGLLIYDGHHRYIAAKILNVPLRVKVTSMNVPGWDINEFIISNNAALKKYGRKYLR